MSLHKYPKVVLVQLDRAVKKLCANILEDQKFGPFCLVWTVL